MTERLPADWRLIKSRLTGGGLAPREEGATLAQTVELGNPGKLLREALERQRQTDTRVSQEMDGNQEVVVFEASQGEERGGKSEEG